MTGFCHRLQRPLRETSGSIVDPSELVARVLVMDVCWGFAPPPRLIDGYFGVGYGLRLNPRIGAILCTWDLAFAEPLMVSWLSALIAAGTDLGSALATYMRSEKARSFKHRLCLLGDPRFRLPQLPQEATQPPADDRPDVLWAVAGPPFRQPRPSLDSTPAAQTQFLRMLVRGAGSWSGLPAQARAGLVPIESALDAVERADPGTTDTRVLELQRSLLQAVSSFRFAPWHTWLNTISNFAHQPTVSECSLCCVTLQCYRAEFDSLPNYARYVWSCHNCGIVADSGSAAPVLLGYERGVGFKLHGRRTEHFQLAALTVTPSLQSAHQSWPWPRTEANVLGEYFHPEFVFPVGPTHVTAYLMDGLDLVFASCRPRFDDAGA